jgi:hypothetical protein
MKEAGKCRQPRKSRHLRKSRHPTLSPCLASLFDLVVFLDLPLARQIPFGESASNRIFQSVEQVEIPIILRSFGDVLLLT